MDLEAPFAVGKQERVAPKVEHQQKKNEICKICFFKECCCEQDYIECKEKIKDRALYHSAKQGSSLYRKIFECQCKKHFQNISFTNAVEEAECPEWKKKWNTGKKKEALKEGGNNPCLEACKNTPLKYIEVCLRIPILICKYGGLFLIFMGIYNFLLVEENRKQLLIVLYVILEICAVIFRSGDDNIYSGE
tara:strand:+ start:1234 stop:1806 length:573 start_codon:yes stop_codon:yes gene_type:complete